MNTSPLLVRARALTGFAELVGELGGNVDGLLRDVGLTRQMLIRPEATISMSGAVTLLENAAAQLAAPDFGLRLAQRQDYSALGPIALIARRADTVGNALVAIARNLPYHVARTSLRMEAGPGEGLIWLRYELPSGICGAQRQSVEMCCLLLIQTLRMLMGGTGAGWRVVFAHPAGMPLAILSFGIFLIGLFGILAHVMIAIAKEKQAAILSVGIIIINLILNYTLIPVFGIAGAAMATLISAVLLTACSGWIVVRTVGIDLQLRSLFRIPALLVLLYYFSGSGITEAVSLPLAYIILYGLFSASLLISGEISKQDLDVIKGIVIKRKP